MWLVVGGPLSVVIACAITAYFVLRAPDVVLRQTDPVDTSTLTQRKGAGYAPAHNARNHAATGGVAQ